MGKEEKNECVVRDWNCRQKLLPHLQCVWGGWLIQRGHRFEGCYPSLEVKWLVVHIRASNPSFSPCQDAGNGDERQRKFLLTKYLPFSFCVALHRK